MSATVQSTGNTAVTKIDMNLVFIELKVQRRLDSKICTEIKLMLSKGGIRTYTRNKVQ